MQITADISKISKNVLRGLTFIFDVLSESRIGFVSFLVFLALENVFSFTKTCFHGKRSNATMRTMWKRLTPTLAIIWHQTF